MIDLIVEKDSVEIPDMNSETVSKIVGSKLLALIGKFSRIFSSHIKIYDVNETFFIINLFQNVIKIYS